VSIDARFAVPANLPRLVDQYAGKTPASVRFRLPSWEAALAGIPGPAEQVAIRSRHYDRINQSALR
jgi:hypothetical protein